MKIVKIPLLIFIFTSLIACEPLVTFKEPQPTNTRNLSKIPNRLQGEYLSIKDRSTLSINDLQILRIYDFDYNTHLNQLENDEKLIGDTIVNRTTNEKTPVKIVGDSIVIHVNFVDTLFRLDNANVLKKFKGYYFISTLHGKNNWEVKKLLLSKGELHVSSISQDVDFESLKQITETPKDTLPPYKFTVTKRQFKKFIKRDGFSESETFVRQIKI